MSNGNNERLGPDNELMRLRILAALNGRPDHLPKLELVSVLSHILGEIIGLHALDYSNHTIRDLVFANIDLGLAHVERVKRINQAWNSPRIGQPLH